MLKLLSKVFKVRKSELEAKLQPVNGHPGWGEIELSEYSDGSIKMEIEYKGATIADGETMDVQISGESVAYATVTNGRVKEWLTSETGAELPHVAEGDVVELMVDDEAIARGTFHPD